MSLPQLEVSLNSERATRRRTRASAATMAVPVSAQHTGGVATSLSDLGSGPSLLSQPQQQQSFLPQPQQLHQPQSHVQGHTQQLTLSALGASSAGAPASSFTASLPATSLGTGLGTSLLSSADPLSAAGSLLSVASSGGGHALGHSHLMVPVTSGVSPMVSVSNANGLSLAPAMSTQVSHGLSVFDQRGTLLGEPNSSAAAAAAMPVTSTTTPMGMSLSYLEDIGNGRVAMPRAVFDSLQQLLAEQEQQINHLRAENQHHVDNLQLSGRQRSSVQYLRLDPQEPHFFATAHQRLMEVLQPPLDGRRLIFAGFANDVMGVPSTCVGCGTTMVLVHEFGVTSCGCVVCLKCLEAPRKAPKRQKLEHHESTCTQPQLGRVGVCGVCAEAHSFSFMHLGSWPPNAFQDLTSVLAQCLAFMWAQVPGAPPPSLDILEAPEDTEVEFFSPTSCKRQRADCFVCADATCMTTLCKNCRQKYVEDRKLVREKGTVYGRYLRAMLFTHDWVSAPPYGMSRLQALEDRILKGLLACRFNAKPDVPLMFRSLRCVAEAKEKHLSKKHDLFKDEIDRFKDAVVQEDIPPRDSHVSCPFCKPQSVATFSTFMELKKHAQSQHIDELKEWENVFENAGVWEPEELEKKMHMRPTPIPQY